MTVETTVLLPTCDVDAFPGTDVTDADTDEFNETDVAGKIVVTLDWTTVTPVVVLRVTDIWLPVTGRVDVPD